MKECIRFSGFMVCIKHSNPTGANADDMVRLATAMYNNVKVASATDDCDPVFKLLDAYDHVSPHLNFRVEAQ